MKRIILSIIIGLIITSCIKSKQENDIKNTKQSELTKKEFYLKKMKEKKFQLEINGSCDDAIHDTIHERSVVYFESKVLTDSNVIVEFKFIDSCCKEFFGDYSIDKDTIKFRFEQVNNEVCGCLCWYRYKLTINESKEKYKDIKIELK